MWDLWIHSKEVFRNEYNYEGILEMYWSGAKPTLWRLGVLKDLIVGDLEQNTSSHMDSIV